MTPPRAAAWFAFVFACAAAHAAPPPLHIPHGHLGQPTAGIGPSAVWRAQDGTSFTIQTRYDFANATGTVQRRVLSIGPDGVPSFGESPAWDAGAILSGDARKVPATAPSPAPGLRNIFTMGGQPAPAIVPFKWDSLPAMLREQLDAPAGSGLGEARTAFLRGERSREQGQPAGIFRQRAAILGDVGHSTPLIVGPPSSAVQGTQYETFREQYKGRRMAVYVGANDGMLHAFAADDGTELFAYVPATLASNLIALASPAYQPRSYVDGSAGQAEAQVDGRWRSVLVAGMGMGARGVFALDISDPAQFDRGLGALWEFTEKDDPAMGHVRPAPQIVKLKTGSGKKSAQRYFALVSSGINSLAPDGNGALFLLALDKPPYQRWQAGRNYTRIDTSGADTAMHNALSAPAIAIRPDGSAAYAYAGDLQGRLWRFDLTTNTARHLFTARDRTGTLQPIAHAPKVVFAPGGGFLILFGTGKLLELEDLLKPSFKTQSMYAIHDTLAPAAEPIRSRAQLAARTLTGTDSFNIKGEALDFFEPNAKRGWYFDFPNARSDGERAAGSPSSVAGAIVFETYLPSLGPGLPASTRMYFVDSLSGFAIDGDGTASPDVSTGELAMAHSLMPALLVSSAVSTSGRNGTGAATATRSVTLVRPDGATPAIELKVRFPAKRLGWREVANWQELHDAAKKR